MSDRDDTQIGLILSRREMLASLSAVGASFVVPTGTGPAAGRILLAGAVVPACVVRPAQTEGPYFVDTRLDRSDIRVDPTDGRVPAGAQLDLAITVSRLDGATCAPYPGVLVDLWQCDAVGVYSGVRDTNRLFDTTGKQFLRGHQRTGPDGVARFRTIYPGWYQGRTPHIHFKLRTDPDQARGREFVSQLYFDDATSDRIFAVAPYSTNRQRRVRNGGDGIYRRGGAELTIPVESAGDGYRAGFDVGLAIA